MSWTDDRVSLLRKLWGEGHTAAEIAKKLGDVTRNAVIGKAHRLKLSNRASPIQQNKKPANKNVERKAPVEKAKVPTARAITKAEIEKVANTSVSANGKLYSLMELQPRQCRWPCGDPKEENFGFCGSEGMPGLPYCEEHSKIAYQAATRNRIFSADKTAQKQTTKLSAEINKNGVKKVAAAS